MIKAFKIFSWITGLLTCVIILMFTIGATYEIPLDSLYAQIFKPMLICWVISTLTWAVIFVYGNVSGKFDNL